MPTSWNDKLRIGVGAIDAQHEALYASFDAFIEAASDRDRPAAATQALDVLSRYVDEHFGDEEAAMAASAYPGLALHRDMHRAFTDELDEITARHRVHGATPSLLLALANLFESWLTLHISLVDQKFGEFLRAREPAR